MRKPTNISKRSERVRVLEAINESLRKPIYEYSVAQYDAMIKKATEYGDEDLVKRLTDRRDNIIAKQKEANEQTRFVSLGNIPVTISKATTSSRSISVNYDFGIYEYFPSKQYIMACIVPKSSGNLCAAVILNPNGEINLIRDEKLTNDLLKELGCVSLIKTNNFNWMIDIIQSESRDPETNLPRKSNYKISRMFANNIQKLTGIKFNHHIFAKTRGNYATREMRKDDYVYIGGFNITDNVKVRICRYISAPSNDGKIYHVYIKVFDYAFMLRIRYTIRDTIVFGGLASGTAYTMLVDKGYIEKPNIDPAIVNSKVSCNMLNILPFMKDIQANAVYDFPNGETNLCDLILSNITRVIADKEFNDKFKEAILKEPLNLSMFEKDYKFQSDRLEALKAKNSDANMEDAASVDDSSDEDYGM